MLTILKMAWRNIFRYRSRTTITLVSIVVSVFIAILVDAFLMGVFTQSEVNMLSYECSEVVVYADGYLEKKELFPADIVIESDTRNQIESAFRREGIDYSPQYRTTAELVFYDEDADFEGTLNTILLGVNPNMDSNVFLRKEGIETGEWLEEGDDGIVVGAGIAGKLGLEVGDILTVECKGMSGFAQTIDVLVKGIMNTENTTFNASYVLMSLDQMDAYLELDGAVNMYAISDGKLSRASDSFTEKVRRVLSGIDGIQVYDFEEDNAGYMAVLNGDKGGSYMVLVFLFIIAGAGIVNTMVMSVLERRKENAMLRAMGFKARTIRILFLTEGMIVGVIGSILGTLLGALVNYPFARFGIDLSNLMDGVDMGYRISFVFKSAWSSHSFVSIPILAVILSTLASFIPVSRVNKGEIAATLRKV